MSQPLATLDEAHGTVRLVPAIQAGLHPTRLVGRMRFMPILQRARPMLTAML